MDGKTNRNGGVGVIPVTGVEIQNISIATVSDNIRRSERLMHEGNSSPVSCKYCGALFMRKKDMIEHIRVHVLERALVCKCCNEKFADKLELDNHVNLLHGGKNKKIYSCNECQREFVNKSHLDYHNNQKHTGGMLYTCTYCKRQFSSSVIYRRHLKDHQDSGGYSCDYCNKSFCQKSFLMGHIRKAHSEEFNEKYVCICERRFVNKSHLNYHMKTHFRDTDKDYFTCPHCGKQFVRRSAFDNHLLVHETGFE